MDVIYRNITNKYFDYRREIKRKRNRFKLSAYEELNDNDSGRENLLKNEDIEMQEESMLPPYWIETTEECTEDINNIKTKLLELQKLQKNKLFNVLNNDEKLSEEISQMSTDITMLIKKCEQKIHTIPNDDNNNVNNKDYIIEKLKKNAKTSLISQLQYISKTFQKKQNNYIKEYKKLTNNFDQVEQYQNDTSHKIYKKQNSDIFIQGEINEEYNMHEQQSLYEQPNQVNLLNINKRNSDLQKITNTVIDLHNIFKELSIMLVDQGSLLDQIDYNIDMSLDKSEKGLNQLKKLEKQENGKIAARCVSFLTTLIFILLILIILKHLY
ncbi:SNARE protein, putative [Plasmodium berghei]|uniref:SNARE protein, putative n=2 Tax=Plasmodium berghei TaxID=5821 RepID=A0A509AVS3_PLABA|nr:SNARE protein, putative [Plasmodium berghei ANKA]CXJ27507.1 SNARE protein, putative [Plasmodium berghei]SCM27002.1 SNARE protein, putative [Plasmodium berghei]SCN28745.1 SNARE protein, putative [Plasmodium berghei]SCO63007.1 SNARE protein, putative [Plasmodium berghei]SCO64492.1 SNARE protein, putative [Plasmodium berghei]|eukprot:XP_034424391.1 SNARE protein, putative [Plasmodium berghei ANKA]